MAARTPVEELLSSVDLFSGLGAKALGKVAARCRSVEHPQGKDIVVEGDGGAGFHLIVSGTAEVLVGGVVTGSLSAGQWFGDISLVDGAPRSATVRATTPVSSLALTSWDFRPLLEDEPEIARNLLLVMCRRLRAAEAR